MLAVILLISVLATSSGWNNVLSPARNDLVFAHRNRDYGAYVIRQEHHRTMIIAFFVSIGVIATALFVPRLFGVEPPPPAIPIPTGEVIFEIPIDPPPPAPDPKPVQPKPSGSMATGPITAVDSVVTAPMDTTSTTVVTPVIGTDTTGTIPTPPTGNVGTGVDKKKVREGYEADVAPEYPGGLPAMYGYLKTEVAYPTIDQRQGKQGRVVVSFVVAEDGTVKDAVVLVGISPTIDAEALRVVRKMRRWKPGQFRGENVPVRFNLPIMFTLR
ncbi:MAG: energy transducer TonB [Flavobacteriales bacterium]